MIKIRYLALLAAMLFLFAAVPALANSPAPNHHWLEVGVEEAPDDLEITVKVKETGRTSYLEAFPMEDGGYYFVRPSFESDDSTLVIRTGGREYDFEVTPNMLRFGADLSFTGGEPRLTERTKLTEYLPSALASLIITLVIEGLMLFVFGYRKPRSYIVFLITNVITQVALHTSYLAFDYVLFLHGLLLVELGVIAVEAASYCLFFRELSRGRAIGYAIAANSASLILGIILLTLIF